MRPIPDRAVPFVGQLEGCELVAYPDPASGGDPWTVGYGHTGPEVNPGMKITSAQAVNFLKADLATARARLFGKIGGVMDELSEAQFCALLSFVLNLGAGDPKKPTWRIWTLLKARQYDQVPAELMRFVNAAGKPNKGLTNRRLAECGLWNEGASDEPLPSSATRSMPTPPTPAASAVAPDNTLWGKCAGAIGGCGLAAKAVSDTIAPYASISPHVGQAVAFLGATLAAIGVAALIVDHMKKKHA